MAGRGGDHLENTTKISILSNLNKATALYVLAEDRLKVEAITEEKGRLLFKLQQLNITLPALVREFPADLTSDFVNVDACDMKKAEVVELITKLRKKMKKCYNIFIEAEDLIERSIKGDDFQECQNMEDVQSSEYQGSDVESEAE